ncbi:alpha-D-ribose 1-methylphosphonate 5-triphosphate diphosphatase [Pseudarthrobacter sp. SSS035]|uniref:alpha-D-ribose 1-methylphosphonate 5-triphosphate diphosphatase n=1 Tax=Pseudarthrobacter sp. SSS035 TaxID=2931399 RepID=UPI00200DE24E|nr:alpha-D-ribose 1-methylphosphonate 5-triphosphate diphosphatase [Pseudarthrobacter sp. SSS035]
MVARYSLGHVRAVTPEGILEDQLISIADGVIQEVRQHPAGVTADIDGRGRLCLPGLVDLHSDALAREYRPRPGASLPVELAIQSAEGNLLAAGVTTAFHAVSFQLKSAVGIPIGSPRAPEVHTAVTRYPEPRMDHRVLHRLDVRSRGGVDMFREQLNGEQTPLVSYEDHTPGQGQYRDRTVMERWLQDAQHMDQRRAAEHVDQLIASRDEELPFREEILAWLGGLAAAKSIRLMGHDAVTPAEIDELAARNASIAEFPTTIEAALHAKQLGIDTVAGAPNVLLGGSHSGNVSALDLARAGCLNILASDYLPSSLLAAAFEIARLGHASLPAAIRMISANPAAAVGLDDRGVLEAGRRADLVVCTDAHSGPRVVRTFTALENP